MNTGIFRFPFNSRVMKFALSLLLSGLLIATEAVAQNFWQQTNGPYGGTIPAFAIDSTGNIFAGTDGGGIFRSTDDGENWTPVNMGLTNTSIWSFVVNSSGHIFAGTDGRFFRSIDNGTSWTPVNTGLISNRVNTFAINANGYIFAGTHGGGVFRSVQSTLPSGCTPIAYDQCIAPQRLSLMISVLTAISCQWEIRTFLLLVEWLGNG
jgi:ligand-binding sensor domain-containing protein